MRKLFSLFAALTLSVGLWAANSVITFTSTSKLYPGDINELMDDFWYGDGAKWAAFKDQYPEFASMNPMALEEMGVSFFNPNAFLDANGQVLDFTYNYDDATKTGTITFAGELVTMYGNDNTGVYAFIRCSSLTSITLPEGLTSIGEHSFRGCSSLASVTFPESLTTIVATAFAECSSLTSITIPANVTEIGYGAFISCSGLTDFYVAWTITLPTIEENLFLYASIGTATLHVPTGTTATYAAADQWKDFGSIVEPAPTPVSTTYLDENGEEQNIDAFEVKDASETVTWGTAGQTTWYVVNGTDVQLAKGAICNGDVRLILADNAKLTATQGITVSGEGNSLTIYGQSTGDEMGQLIADATSVYAAAGIGGGNNGSGSNITINGGIVTATGGTNASGIGGGKYGSGSNITINGGIITATGGGGAAGIGGGINGEGSNITINGGAVEATGGSAAAGIGGGNGGAGSNITINGGTVTANNGSLAAGIGGGNNGVGSNITINGGTITANGGNLAAGIGGGRFASGSNIYISDAYILKAGASENPTEVIAHSSAQDLGGTLTQRYVKVEGLATPYTRSMTIDNWATVCLPYEATGFSGATFYKLNYFDQVDKLYIEEVETLEAGMPYIFQATADVVTIGHGDATLTYGDEQSENGLYGSFARKTIAYDAEHAFAALANNTVNVIEEGHTVTVPACRAYFDMTKVPTTEQPHSAPLRCIGVPRQTPTSLDKTLDTKHQTQKLLHNGQFVIIRDGKTYNAQGQIIQ